MADVTPASNASQLATLYTQNAQSLLTRQTKTAQSTSSALTKLQSSLQSFNTALTTLSGKKSMQQSAATFSATTHGSATASASAQAGTYSVFVEQIATAHQIAFEDLPAVPVATGGPITVNLGNGGSFAVNLAAADQDSDGTLSQAEIARAINQASGNGGTVTAGVVTVGGKTQMVLSSTRTGLEGAITLDASALPASDLKTALSGSRELAAAQDAVVWLGPQGTGIELRQASNTFTAIDGVSMTFTQAMAAGATPMTLTVAADESGTQGNVKAFVEAYNTLKKALDDLTSTGDADNGVSAAVFASDSGIRNLKNRLNSMIRQDFGGASLMSFGVSADRSGNLSVDNAKLKKAVDANPDGLDALFGKTSLTASSGMLGGLGSYLEGWLSSTNGQIKSRQDSMQRTQKALNNKQTRLDNQYDNYYERYLKQFSILESLQAQMSQSSSLMSSLFSSNSSKS